MLLRTCISAPPEHACLVSYPNSQEQVARFGQWRESENPLLFIMKIDIVLKRMACMDVDLYIRTHPTGGIVLATFKR
jgi:hypothetical protein